MLQTMRNNAQGTLAKIIIGFLVVVFALWGVESIVSIGSGEVAAVEVEGQKITEMDIERAVDRQRLMLSRQFGDQYNADLFNDQFLRQSAIEQLINERVTVFQAKKLGLIAAPRTVDEMIVQEPAFQQDGRFDGTVFRDVLRMNGLTPVMYRDALANDLIVNQAQAGFALSSIATPFAVQLGMSLEQEQRTFSYYEIKVEDLLAEITPAESEIEQAYEFFKEQFRTPEKVAVQYVEVKLEEVAASLEISAQDIEQAYQDYTRRQSMMEQREASHILLELDKRTLVEARALAEQIKQRIEAGESFTELAQQYSDDIGSKNEGGRLGLSPRGSFDEAFDNALYSLPEGDVSTPVETEFGIHLIRADRIVAADIEPLEAIQEALAQDVRLQKAREDYEQRIMDLSDAAFSVDSIAELAEQLQLPLQQSALFTRDAGEGVGENEQVRDTAYADNILYAKELSPMIELNNSALVLAVNEHQEESYLTLAEVRDQLVAQVKQQQALALAQQRIAAIAEGEQQVQWAEVTTAYAQSSEAPLSVQQRAFSVPIEVREQVQTQQGFAVLEVSAIETKPWQQIEVADEQSRLAQMFSGRVDLFSYQNWARNATKVKIKGS